MYVDGRPVCDSSWDLADASAVCRMLFPNITSAVAATTGSTYGFTGGSFSTLMTNVTCWGNETDIRKCQHDILNVTEGCSCTDFVNKNGYGQCKKGSSVRKLPFCYVELPSTCEDKKQSTTDPDKWNSHDACSSK